MPPASLPKYPALDAAVLRFSSRADRIRQDLYYCDTVALRIDVRHMRANVHAASYVYLAAAVEATVGELLTALTNEIQAAVVSTKDLRLTLLAVAQGPRLDSLRDVRGLKMWLRRSELFAAVDDTAHCSLPAAHLPLDGRTIRPDHLDAIWAVFGFPGKPFPGPMHILALTDLADTRNSIAHGDEDPARIAGRKSITDTLRILSYTEDLVIHMWTTGTEYLAQHSYLR